ncbi:MAG: hypothetical protein ACXU8U_04430 [Asticcacaulis sp.]
MSDFLVSKRKVVGGLCAAAPMAMLAGMARADDGVVKVPLLSYQNVMPVVQVHIEGKGPYAFMVSTGLALNTIDDDLARELGLKPVNGLRNFLLGSSNISAGKKEGSHQVAAALTTIGDGYALRDLVFDISTEDSEQGRDWHARHVGDENFPRGGLGMQLLLSAPCVLDFEGRELRFYKGGLPQLTDYTALRSELHGSVSGGQANFAVHATLGGQGLKCYVDTAGTAELYLASRFVRDNNLYDRKDDYIAEPLNRVDPSKGMLRTVRMKNFDLGAIHFDEINVTLGDPDHDDYLHELGIKAVIGRNLWRQFTMAFPGDGRILVKPNGWFKTVSDPYKITPYPD